MKCPFCAHDDTQVKDSRPSDDGVAIRRRRECSACGGRFTTFERVQLRDLVVIKGDGRREPFDREKLARSLRLALQKRPVGAEAVEHAVTGIVRQLESLGDAEVPAALIGEHAMRALAVLDQVAYVRYASVYKNFHEIGDFNAFLGKLGAARKAGEHDG